MFIEYRGKTPNVHPTAFVAPTAVLIGDVEVGEQASIWFGAVIRGDNGPIRIGARSNVQDNAVLHTSAAGRTVVGTDVTIGHSAAMEDCTIEDGALIGTGAVVLGGAVIGARSLVAAGSVVTSGTSVPPAVLVAGAPAVVKKPLGDTGLARVGRGGPAYVALSRNYLQHGVGDPDIHEMVDASYGPA